MTVFKDFFHTNYTSSGTPERYVKISIFMHGIGMFCVIMNKRTRGVQCQKYELLPNGQPNARHYIGISTNGYSCGVCNLAQRWKSISSDEQDMLLVCSNVLDKSFRQFYASIPSNTLMQNEVVEHINSLRVQLCNLKNGKEPSVQTTTATTMTQPQNATTETHQPWVAIEFNSLSSADLQEIIKKINDENNPEFGIIHNGKKYKIFRGDRGMELRTMDDVATPQPQPQQQPQPAVSHQPLRITVQKAQMRDNTNLTEFVNGCYYKIVKFIDSQFVTIENDNGEERTVNKKRVAFVDVYDEAPANA